MDSATKVELELEQVSKLRQQTLNPLYEIVSRFADFDSLPIAIQARNQLYKAIDIIEGIELATESESVDDGELIQNSTATLPISSPPVAKDSTTIELLLQMLEKKDKMFLELSHQHAETISRLVSSHEETIRKTSHEREENLKRMLEKLSLSAQIPSSISSSSNNSAVFEVDSLVPPTFYNSSRPNSFASSTSSLGRRRIEMANNRDLDLHANASDLEQELIKEIAESPDLAYSFERPLDSVRRHSRVSDFAPIYQAPREQRMSTLSPNLGMLDPFGYGIATSTSPYDTALQYSSNPSTRNRSSQFGRPASNPNSRYPSSSDLSSISISTTATSPIPWRGEESGPLPAWQKPRSASLGEEERGGQMRSRLGYISSGLASEIEVEETLASAASRLAAPETIGAVASDYSKSRLYQRTLEAQRILDKEKARQSLVIPNNSAPEISPASTKVSSSSSSFITTSSKRKTFSWFRSNSTPVAPAIDPPAMPLFASVQKTSPNLPRMEAAPPITRPSPIQSRRQSDKSIKSLSRNSMDFAAKKSPPLSPLILTAPKSNGTLRPPHGSDSSTTPSLENEDDPIPLSTPPSSASSPTTPHHSQVDLSQSIGAKKEEVIQPEGRKTFGTYFSSKKDSQVGNVVEKPVEVRKVEVNQSVKKLEEKKSKSSNGGFFRNWITSPTPITLTKPSIPQHTSSKSLPVKPTPATIVKSKSFFSTRIRTKSTSNLFSGNKVPVERELPLPPLRQSSRTLPTFKVAA